jgi:redox-sensitive bicupin YhaK (pirin superfamily)
MIKLRKAGERGPTKIDWLDSRHTFSFGGYRDPGHTGFRDLLVINEDRVKPGAGFSPHAHQDMEIISYVIDGALEHKDSIGNGSVIRPGEIQRMSAGSGIRHSEFNASKTDPVHFLQIWISPGRAGIAPGYEQAELPPVTAPAQLDLIAAPSGGPGAVALHQDARIYRGSLEPGAAAELPVAAGRHAWVQVVRGAATVNGVALAEGDGLALSDEAKVSMAGAGPKAELLIFDLA